MKTENKQYKLKKWYPTLPNDWKTEHDYVYYKEESLMINKLLMTTHIINFKHLEYRDFWEEVKQPLFVTEDGVEVYDIDSLVFIVEDDFKKSQRFALAFKQNKNDMKSFYHESNADEYIWRNKRVFSYEDIMDNIYMQIEEDVFQQLAKERSEE